MITQFKIFEGITYPFEQSIDQYDNVIYTFTNKTGTKYEVTFADLLMSYQTDKKGLDETNEFDLINVFTTLASIVKDYLNRFDDEIYIDNIDTKKEQEIILKKVKNDTAKALDLSRKTQNKRTENMKIFLAAKLSKKYKIEVLDDAVNMIHVYSKTKQLEL